jgi:phosphatidylglycerol lysyltransferase
MKRRWILWILVVIFIWVVISQLSAIRKLVETLQQGEWQWVAVAALTQVIYYINYAATYQSGFLTVGLKSRLADMVPLTFASIFLNVAAPSGGASSMALFADDATKRGQSGARAAVGTYLVLVAHFSAFLVILLVGMIYLFSNHNLKLYEGAAALFMVLGIGVMTAELLLGMWRPQLLHRLLTWAQQLTNRIARIFKRPDFLDERWVEKTTTEFTEAAMAIAANPGQLMHTVGIAFIAHLLDLTSLYFVVLAFHQPMHFGVLVAGYSMGILFWVVSITPQGIGVVEGMMTLVFASLGVPIERATAIALSFRGLTFWIPLGIGFIVLRRLKSFGAKETVHTEPMSVRIAALLTVAMGLMDVLSGLTPTIHNRLAILEQYSPFGVDIGGQLISVLAGFALLLLANGLWRRKRLAWALTITILLFSVPVHSFKGLDYEEAALGACLAIWLFYLRPHFHARSDPPSIQQGLLALLVAVIFTISYGVLGFSLLDQYFLLNGQPVNFNVWGALHQTMVMFAHSYFPDLIPTSRFARYFANSIYIVSMVTVGYALLMLVRPVLVRQGASGEQRRKARQIVEAYGCTSLARLLILDDKMFYFSPAGSVIGYVIEGRVALTLGDPIGPGSDTAACISNFASFCSLNDWQPAYFQVLPDNLNAYQALGYHALCIGHEAIVELSSFNITGDDKEIIRTGVNGICELGYQAEVLKPPHPTSLMSELRQVNDEWLTSVKGTERRFSLGWFDENYLNSTPVIIITDPQGYVDAFANILLAYQANEVGIDLVRHRAQAEKGEMDFLLVSLFKWAKAQGYGTCSMGLSGLAGIGEKSADPVNERALHYIYEHVNQINNFKGLDEFKAKYDPIWSPRYLIYPNAASLPSIVIAMMRADSGPNILGGYHIRIK